MDLNGKRVVITGGARGIGQALAEAFRTAGAAVLTADLDGADVRCDVRDESQLRELIAAAGEIDLFCSNAGVAALGGPESPDEQWQRQWDVNVMAHVRAARLLLPQWLDRGHGYFLQTVSAAGLLTMLGSAGYSTTKHAALGFAEWLSITYHDRGIRVSALCPMGVRTEMYDKAISAGLTFLADGAISPGEAAAATVEGIRDERFLILPHRNIGDFFVYKAQDYESWLRGMRDMQAHFF